MREVDEEVAAGDDGVCCGRVDVDHVGSEECEVRYATRAQSYAGTGADDP